jgi:hypothetical protein
MRRPRTALIALALCALPLAALTACSSSPSKSAASSSDSGSSGSKSSGTTSNVKRPTDMCALLSTAEASADTHSKIATTYKAENSCGYSGEDLHFAVRLVPTEIDSLATDEKLLSLDIGKMSPISGVGDEAAGNAKGLDFRTGSVIIDVETDPGTTNTTQDEMVAVAKTVLSHLG